MESFVIFIISQCFLWLYCTRKKVDMIQAILSSLYLCILYGILLMVFGIYLI